jgi:prophage tail gpP-like protein
MADELTLHVDGRAWEGWEEASVTTVFGKSLCGKFELTLADKWRADFNARPIRTGMRCEVLLAGELLITGWIDDVDPSYDANSHGITISGRDLTSDLVDCSSTVTPGAWTNLKLEAIARELTKEFSIDVVDGDDTGTPIAQARLQEGESPFQFLEKLCRSRNVWPTTTARGELTFRKASTERLDGVLRRGHDIKFARGRFSDTGRFSTYIGKGQQRGRDHLSAEAAAHVTARVDDPSITRHRPLVVQGEDQQNGETLGDRVKNEMAKRIGDSRTIDIGVAGWRLRDGRIWPVNRRVAIDDDWLGLQVEYAISAASFKIAKNAFATTLTLVPPEMFDIHYSGTKLAPAIGSGVIGDDDSRNWDRLVGPI